MDGRAECWWFLSQLYGGHLIDGDFISFRCIHNERPSHHPQTGQPQFTTKCLFNKNISSDELRSDFVRAGGLFDQFTILNRSELQPANPYFGVNPRNSATDNKKINVRCFVAFYLDLDVNSQYSLEDRQQQLSFWSALGFEPTLTVFSGHGFQPYWVLAISVPCDVGEPILKKIVALAGCKQGGNTWDCTRVLRLPGYKNVKEWFSNDTPDAKIIWPMQDAIEESIVNKSLRIRYTIEQMAEFPLSTKEAIQRFTEQARAMDGDYAANLQQITRAFREQQTQAAAQNAAQTLAVQQTNTTARADLQAEIVFVPKRNFIPPDIKDVPFKQHARRWMRLYCTKGYHGLTPADKELIAKATDRPLTDKPDPIQEDLDASALDGKVIFALIEMGYTEEAVTEFWNRSELKLFRDYKFQKNPNYITITYNNMLDSVRTMKAAKPNSKEAMAARTEAGFGPNCIYVGPDGETYIGTSTLPRKVLSVEMRLVQVMVNVDEQNAEYWKIRITAKQNDGSFASHLRFIPRDAFDAVCNLKKYCTDKLFCMTDKGPDLAALAKKLYEEREDRKLERFHTSMIYDKENNQFIFPQMLIGREEFIQLESFANQDLKDKFPWHDCFVTSAVSKETVQEILQKHWNKLIRIHLPRLVCSVLGSIAANGARAIIHTKKIASDISMPCVNVRGRGSSGKTETCKILFKLSGMSDPKKTFQSLASSNFALGRMAELIQFTPIPIDEFKEQEHNRKRISELRQLIKSTYTGEMISKGRQDLGVTRSALNSQFIPLGESVLERANDIAESSRIFGVDTDEFTPDSENDDWPILSAAPLENIGPHLYQWLLNINHEEWYQKLLALRKELIRKLSDDLGIEKIRTGNNLATMIWGCHLWDAFVIEMCPDLDRLTSTFDFDEIFVNYITNQKLENEAKMSIEIDGKKQIIVKDEAIAFIEAIADMHNTSFKDYETAIEKGVYVFKEETNKVKIHLKNAYELYQIKANFLRETVPDLKIINLRLRGALARKERWIVAKNVLIKYRGKPIRVLELNKLALQQMNIWHLQTVSEDPHILTTTTENLATVEERKF